MSSLFSSVNSVLILRFGIFKTNKLNLNEFQNKKKTKIKFYFPSEKKKSVSLSLIE